MALDSAGIESLVGSKGGHRDSYDRALALYKADVIHRQPWKAASPVELAALNGSRVKSSATAELNWILRQ